MIFRDRTDAGSKLARALTKYRGKPGVIVLALPRGGVPVAFEVAKALATKLDVFLVRKLGVPGHEELAMGAISTGGVRVVNRSVVDHLGITEDVIDSVAVNEQLELERREKIYRGDRDLPELRNSNVILIDDGLATGSTMRAAVAALKQHQPARIIVAVPVASIEACEEVGEEVDEIVCVDTPEPFRGVGMWYEDFSQTTDDEVRALLALSSRAESSVGDIDQVDRDGGADNQK